MARSKVELFEAIRRDHRREELSIRGLADRYRVHRRTVREALGSAAPRWPSADTHDVARLYRLALESAPAGSRLHAVAEEGIALREIAEVIGAIVGVSVAPVAAEDAEQHFGHLTMFVGLDNPTSSQVTREALDWTPDRPGLLADLRARHAT